MNLKKAFLLTPLLFSAIFVLNGCGTMPASGPYSKDFKKANGAKIIKNEPKVDFKYEVQDIDNNIISTLNSEENRYLSSIAWPASAAANDIKVNIGDTIQVSVFESESGGLFVPVDAGVRPGNFVTLPAQTIDVNGTIKVPYAGEVQAAGKATEEIALNIESLLENQAIEPQVVVSFDNRAGAEMSVIGDVNNARRVPLGFNSYKILDAIAAAGGPNSAGYETWVQLQRDSKEYTIPFDQLVLNPQQNIYAEINDTLYLYRQPEVFNAYGAVRQPGTIPFGKRDLSLSEALGISRGLVDGQADPAEIYIYRKPIQKQSRLNGIKKVPTPKKTSMIDSIRVLDKVYNVKSKKTKTPLKIATNNNQPARIYKLNLRDPSGLFLAQKFMMQDQDIIYVANAESVEFMKFLNILGTNATTTTSTRNAYD